MSIKIALIGAGSGTFSLNLIRDMCLSKYLDGSTLCMMDINEEKLNTAYKFCSRFAKEIGIYGSAYTNTMMVDLGETLYFAAGSDRNIKLTSKDDLALFRAYLRMEND